MKDVLLIKKKNNKCVALHYPMNIRYETATYLFKFMKTQNFELLH